jgi:hypothetical protein
MVEAILGNLSWTDLAPIASTCKAFQTASRKELALEQKRRCNLALACFGCGRIERIADLLKCYLAGLPLDPKLSFEPPSKYSSISENGTLRGAPRNMSYNPFYMGRTAYVSRQPTALHIDVTGDTGLRIHMFARPESRVATIKVFPCDNEDIQGVALLQALLAEGLTLIAHATQSHLDIRVMRDDCVLNDDCMERSNVTQAGLRMQIAPLLPFGTVYASWYRSYPSSNFIGERV